MDHCVLLSCRSKVLIRSIFKCHHKLNISSSFLYGAPLRPVWKKPKVMNSISFPPRPRLSVAFIAPLKVPQSVNVFISEHWGWKTQWYICHSSTNEEIKRAQDTRLQRTVFWGLLDSIGVQKYSLVGLELKPKMDNTGSNTTYCTLQLFRCGAIDYDTWQCYSNAILLGCY